MLNRKLLRDTDKKPTSKGRCSRIALHVLLHPVPVFGSFMSPDTDGISGRLLSGGNGCARFLGGASAMFFIGYLRMGLGTDFPWKKDAMTLLCMVIGQYVGGLTANLISLSTQLCRPKKTLHTPSANTKAPCLSHPGTRIFLRTCPIIGPAFSKRNHKQCFGPVLHALMMFLGSLVGMSAPLFIKGFVLTENTPTLIGNRTAHQNITLTGLAESTALMGGEMLAGMYLFSIVFTSAFIAIATCCDSSRQQPHREDGATNSHYVSINNGAANP